METLDDVYRAHCNYCTMSYTWKKGIGYSLMHRHLKSKHPSEYSLEKSQMQISKASIEKQGKPFKYLDDNYHDGSIK